MQSTGGILAFYGSVKLIHIACVTLSGSLFTFRGGLMLADSPVANHPLLARLSIVIDTTLLGAAILLTRLIQQYPFVQSWLTAKVLLLAAYVGLGILALRRGRTRPIRAAYFLAALAIYVCIIGVAVTHDPRGWFMRY